MSNTALITGINGQDGSYLAELLLSKGYRVHGLIRRASTFNRGRIEHLHTFEGTSGVVLHYGDMTDSANLLRVVAEVRPDEVYHLGAQSHVQISFDVPEYTADVDAIGTLRLLDAVHALGLGRTTRVYNASTSELYGKVAESPQTERTPFHPRSPYGVAKLYAYWIGVNYREAYGMFVSNGILFNHESPRRGENFVTRKTTLTIANIIRGKQSVLTLGNLDAARDWGYAPEYVEAMWRILQQAEPDDFVIATGEVHTVREFVEAAFACAGIQIEWRGSGPAEEGIEAGTGRVLVKVSPDYLRPAEVDYLCGDASKAREKLGWVPRVGFRDLVAIMMKAELESVGLRPAEVSVAG